MSTFQKACRKGYIFHNKFAQSRKTLTFFAVAKMISCTESLLFINDISDFFKMKMVVVVVVGKYVM